LYAPPSLLSNGWVLGLFPQGVKQLGREAGCQGENNTSLPHMSSWHSA
jgi:hypothetical protein